LSVLLRVRRRRCVRHRRPSRQRERCGCVAGRGAIRDGVHQDHRAVDTRAGRRCHEDVRSVSAAGSLAPISNCSGGAVSTSAAPPPAVATAAPTIGERADRWIYRAVGNVRYGPAAPQKRLRFGPPPRAAGCAAVRLPSGLPQPCRRRRDSAPLDGASAAPSLPLRHHLGQERLSPPTAVTTQAFARGPRRRAIRSCARIDASQDRARLASA